IRRGRGGGKGGNFGGARSFKKKKKGCRYTTPGRRWAPACAVRELAAPRAVFTGPCTSRPLGPSACAAALRTGSFFQAEDGIRDLTVTGVQTCALPILGIAIREQSWETWLLAIPALVGGLLI